MVLIVRVITLVFSVLTFATGITGGAFARSAPEAAAIDSYIQPHAASGEFSGAVLVSRGGDIVFDQAYGYADIAGHVENSSATSFHIAALSEAYTAAIVMHLVETNSIRLDNTVAQFLPDVPGGGRVTIRSLLDGSSGLADSGAAYKLLARIVEQRMGSSFEDALNTYIFSPRWMDGAGIDADDLEPGHRYAIGYQRDAAGVLRPAGKFRWSDVAGGGSVYTTTQDELRFVNALFDGDLLQPETRAQMFDKAKPGAGYGWFKRDGEAPGGAVYTKSGREGGFSAFVLHVPASNTTVILLGNVDSDAIAGMGEDIAALALRAP